MSNLVIYGVDKIKFSTPTHEQETPKYLRSFTNDLECTIECPRISGYALRLITGKCSNNELRMHHQPMKRKRMSLKKARWKILKVIRTKRGNPDKKIMVIHNKYWK